MEFSWPEHWSGQPLPSPGALPHPGMEARSALQADSFPAGPLGKPFQYSPFLKLEADDIYTDCRANKAKHYRI